MESLIRPSKAITRAASIMGRREESGFASVASHSAYFQQLLLVSALGGTHRLSFQFPTLLRLAGIVAGVSWPLSSRAGLAHRDGLPRLDRHSIASLPRRSQAKA